MTEPLKFTASFGKTINMGNYESIRIDLSMEFFQDETSTSTAFAQVRTAVESMAASIKGAQP